MPPLSVPPRRLVFALLLLAAVLLALPLARVASSLAGRWIRAGAARQGLAASWRSLDFAFPAGIRATGFSLTSPGGADTVLAAETLAVAIAPASLVLLRPRVAAVTLAHARAGTPRRAAVDPDTMPPVREPAPREGPAAPRVMRAAESVVRALLLPARQMPRLSWRDVTLRITGPEDETGRALTFAWLELTPRGGGMTLAAAGTLSGEQRVPFEARIAYGADDRVTGGARLLIPPEAGGAAPAPLTLAITGRVEQDRSAGEVRTRDSVLVTVGRVPFTLEARAARAGPRFELRLAADSLTGARVQASLPRGLLGPLAEVATVGSWDYRLELSLDLARPDSVRLHADVIPHGLRLDPARTGIRLAGLEAPFTATVHLPRGVIAARELSEANPAYLPLDQMDSLLVCAVLTNEDGGFWQHRGFSEEAVRGAIAHNLRAGAFRRGAGTITMQLARNLYLGHERTLARKGQEVVLAWVLEHLAGVSKRRLLEIYLNVIEWGPGVHGANEAARYYFGRDARRLTVDESLFLTIVIPSPSRWRWRFDRDGNLRPFARAQMHFIGRAMVAKGWLRAEELPPAEALAVRLEGPAHDVIFPPPPADTTSILARFRRWLPGGRAGTVSHR